MEWSSTEGIKLLADIHEIGVQNQFDPARMALKLNKLRAKYNSTELHLALEMVLARQRSEKIGPWGSKGYLTRQTLEQASRYDVARHHALHFVRCKHVLEIGTGAGSDTAAIASKVDFVTSIEADKDVAMMARQNLELQNIKNFEIINGRAEELELQLSKFDGLWCDPSRRDPQGRIKDPEQYRPSLSFVMELNVAGPRGIKVSPALNLGTLPCGWSRQFIGVGDECIEQTLWHNTSVKDGSLYLADLDYHWAPNEVSSCAAISSVADLKGYLVEPHAALIRSGFLSVWYLEHECKLIDSNIAFGTCLKPSKSPLSRYFEILEVMPFKLKLLRSLLKQRKWTNKIEIKIRGFPESPETLRANLKLPPSTGQDDPSSTLFIIRYGASHLAILAKRLVK